MRGLDAKGLRSSTPVLDCLENPGFAISRQARPSSRNTPKLRIAFYQRRPQFQLPKNTTDIYGFLLELKFQVKDYLCNIY
jgi:hypothetical protein